MTTQLERADAILMLAAAQERLSYRDDIASPLSVSVALTPADVAALVDFSHEEMPMDGSRV